MTKLKTTNKVDGGTTVTCYKHTKMTTPNQSAVKETMNYIVLGMVASGFEQVAKRFHSQLDDPDYCLVIPKNYSRNQDQTIRSREYYRDMLTAAFRSKPNFVFAAGFCKIANSIARDLIRRYGRRVTVVRLYDVDEENTVKNMLSEWKHLLELLTTTGTNEYVNTPEEMAKNLMILMKKGGFKQCQDVIDETTQVACSARSPIINGSGAQCESMLASLAASSKTVGSSKVAPVAVGSGDVAVGSGDVSEGSGDVAVGSSEVAVGSSEVAEGSSEVAEGSNLFSSSLNRIYGIQISNETLLRSSGLQ